jgi:hypothetical protein
MVIRNCRACDYFVDTGNPVGTCQRFPQYQSRSPNERCGEFLAIPYADEQPEMLALPVREMPTLKQAEEAFDKAYEEHIKPKRRGRPPKPPIELKEVVL